MAGNPSWQQRYDRSVAQEQEANIAAMRVWFSQPLLPFLLKELLVGLGLGLFGWLMINWIWGLISFIVTAGAGPLVRMYALRRYGKGEPISEVELPKAPGGS